MTSYLPVFEDNLEREELIEKYFYLGFKYKEICLFLLAEHGIEISMRHLMRILKERGLSRRRNQSSAEDVYEALRTELMGSGSIIGY